MEEILCFLNYKNGPLNLLFPFLYIRDLEVRFGYFFMGWCSPNLIWVMDFKDIHIFPTVTSKSLVKKHLLINKFLFLRNSYLCTFNLDFLNWYWPGAYLQCRVTLPPQHLPRLLHQLPSADTHKSHTMIICGCFSDTSLKGPMEVLSKMTRNMQVLKFKSGVALPGCYPLFTEE